MQCMHSRNLAWAAHLLMRTEPACPRGLPGPHSVKPCRRSGLLSLPVKFNLTSGLGLSEHLQSLSACGDLRQPLSGARTKVKVRVETAYGEIVERIPAWIKWATQVRGVLHPVMLPVLAV